VYPYFLRLLAVMFNSLSNILCKHLFYFQARVKQLELFFIFHMPVLTTVSDHSQVVPSHRNGNLRINMPSWVSQKTHVSLVPQAQMRPTHSTPVKGSRSMSKLGLQAPSLEAQPQYGASTSTNPALQSDDPERAETHDKKVTSLPAPISKYVLGIRSL
jgi:hypothetical protein